MEKVLGRVGIKLKSMLSFLNQNLIKVPGLVQMTEDEIREKAITMLALLKRDDEILTEEIKRLVKSDKQVVKSITCTEIDGWTLFHAFALRGCRKLLKLAIKSGVDVNLKMGSPEGIPGGCTALHLAAHRGDVSVIDILVSSKGDINVLDNTGKPAVYYAFRANNTLAVKTLKKYGANMSCCEHDVNAENESKSPFCFLPFPGCSGTTTKR